MRVCDCRRCCCYYHDLTPAAAGFSCHSCLACMVKDCSGMRGKTPRSVSHFRWMRLSLLNFICISKQAFARLLQFATWWKLCDRDLYFTANDPKLYVLLRQQRITMHTCDLNVEFLVGKVSLFFSLFRNAYVISRENSQLILWRAWLIFKSRSLSEAKGWTQKNRNGRRISDENSQLIDLSTKDCWLCIISYDSLFCELTEKKISFLQL